MHELTTAWRRALTAEVCWHGRDDQPQGAPVTPLLLGEVPCFALPYSERARADALRSAPEVAFAVTDARSLPHGAGGVAAFGAVTVVEDLDGSVFTEELLEQELGKYPPSRALADNLLLRRENWWWLPRLIVRLDRVRRTAELGARADPAADALLVRDDTGLRIDTVTTTGGSGRDLHLDSLDGTELRGDTAPAVLLGYDYTEPDLERWESWSLRGRFWGSELLVEERHGERGAELPPLRLLERLRRRRNLEKACRRGIAAAERVRP